MGETIQQIKNQLNEFWQEMDKSKKIKIIIIGIIVIIINNYTFYSIY